MSSSNLQPTTYDLQRTTPILIAIAVFSALSITCAITSEGFLEADGCTHYMYARWAFEYPTYFVDIWGRPFKTALYAPAAATLGLIGVRITSLLVAICIAMIAYAIARGQKYRWPALAVIFTFAQPLVFLHSFSELTELPFAMLLGLAFLAYQRRRFWAVALVAGLLPLSRPEGFGFIVLVAILLFCHRQWLWLPLLLLPVMAWQVAGAMMYNEPTDWWRWLPKHWPYAGESLYQRGPIWHFAALLPAAVGPIVFPFLLVGLWKGFEHEETKERSEADSHRGTPSGWLARFVSPYRFRCEVLIAAIPLMILIGHSVLYATGKMASNGELRYMLIVAPFWALLAARGWEWVWERWITPAGLSSKELPPESYAPAYSVSLLCAWKSPLFWAGVAAIVPVFANFGYKVLPLVQTSDWQSAKRIVDWYRGSADRDQFAHIATSHPAILYYMDIAPIDPRVVEWRIQMIRTPPPRTLMIYDPIYGHYNADESKSVEFVDISKAGWQFDSDISEATPGLTGRGDNRFRVYRSPDLK